MDLTVNPDGSGTVGAAMGMTVQARNFLTSSSNGDPFQGLLQSLDASPNNGQEVTVRRWTEGEYEWVQGDVALANLAEINERFGDVGLFESFSLRRETGLLQDRFVLEAALEPLGSFGDSLGNEEALYDPAAFIEMQFTVHMPGELVETNGIQDGNNPGALLWVVDPAETVIVRAVSRTWNWLNVGVLGGAASLLGLGLIILGAMAVVSSRQRKQSRAVMPAHRLPGLPSAQTEAVATTGPATTELEVAIRSVTEASATASVDVDLEILNAIGARALLQEVNHFLLTDTGLLEEARYGLRLSWSAIPGGTQTREIVVRVEDARLVNVNGATVPAHYEAVKTAIATSLRDLDRSARQ